MKHLFSVILVGLTIALGACSKDNGGGSQLANAPQIQCFQGAMPASGYGYNTPYNGYQNGGPLGYQYGQQYQQPYAQPYGQQPYGYGVNSCGAGMVTACNGAQPSCISSSSFSGGSPVMWALQGNAVVNVGIGYSGGYTAGTVVQLCNTSYPSCGAGVCRPMYNYNYSYGNQQGGQQGYCSN